MKKYDILFIVLGIITIAFGVLLFLIGPDHNPSGTGLVKASTSIQFGADFYTTSAQYTALAANALVDLFDLVRYALSGFFVLGGSIIICLACKSISKLKLIKKSSTALSTVPRKGTESNSVPIIDKVVEAGNTDPTSAQK